MIIINSRSVLLAKDNKNFGKQKFDVIRQLKMSKFICDVKQLKMNKFIKSIWHLIIGTLEVPSLRPCFLSRLANKFFFSQKFHTISLSGIVSFISSQIFFKYFFFNLLLTIIVLLNFLFIMEFYLPLHNDFSKEFSDWCNWELNLKNFQASSLSFPTYVFLTKLIWMRNCQSFCNFCILNFSVSFF